MIPPTIVHSSATLVSKTRRGQDKFWQAHVLTDGVKWYTNTSYWQETKDGSKSAVQFSEPYEAKPKNVGRANETTAEQQARSEFDSMVTKQQDKGYAEIGAARTQQPRAMLAEKFADKEKKMNWNIATFVQPKYNGHRMLCDGKMAWSRGGKPIIPKVVEHILSDPIFTKLDGLMLDGELLLPGNKKLEKSSSAIKKFHPGVSDTLLYVVYDVLIPDTTYAGRYAVLEKLFAKTKNTKLILAPTHKVSSVADVKKYHKQFVDAKYEGTIVRVDSEGYSMGNRSSQLLKFKDFMDSEYKIVGVKEGEGKYKGTAIFVCETADGVKFDCTPEGSLPYRRRLYKDRKNHIGKWLTVRYPDVTEKGVPQFGIGVDIREEGEF